MKDNDTPAFPIVHGHFVESLGMTMRDYFAGQALAMSVPDSPKQLAQWCYAVADAMLEARK